MIHGERIRELNDQPIRAGRYVLYWMQQSQRARMNHALEFAIREANRLRLPVVVLFGITQRFPEGQLRHYQFMLNGLAETARELQARGIRFVLSLAPPPDAVKSLADQAALIVADRGYLRIQRAWRAAVARQAPCRVTQIEADVIVPVETASSKEEYAARTLRPKIERQLDAFLVPLQSTTLERDARSLKLSAAPHVVRGFPMSIPGHADRILGRLRLSRKAAPVLHFTPGTSEAVNHLGRFLRGAARRYSRDHSDPSLEATSRLSPYLHFGQISPLEIALAVRGAKVIPTEDRADFLEELIVRRELSMNYCFYNDAYDRYEGLPTWARETLARHRRDLRPWRYTRRQLEQGRTHDPYWNAAQREMLLTGYMQGYMRMYWGKKIIEWSPSPEEAFKIALSLNNTYQLDGRDPNSFTGVAWCFGKHDRPWSERAVFGTVRWMSPQGLERKFDIDAYVKRIARHSASL